MGAVAGNMLVCLVGRAIQGVGAGAVVVLGEIIITDLVPLNERGNWLGWLGTMWTVGGVIGPLTGGLFAQYVSWRWVFWINLPFIAIGSVLLQIFLQQEQIPGHPWKKCLRIDWTGALLFTVSCCAILIPLSIGGILISWEKWPILLSLFVGVDGLIAFVWWEKFHAKEPLIPLTIFHNWTLRSLYLQTVLHALVFWATMYYLPLYYQVVKQYTIFQSGLALLPQTIVVSPLTVIIGILINKLNAYRWSVYGGWFFTTVGAGLLIILDLDTAIVEWIIINVIFCLGIGTLITAMNFAVQAAVEGKYCGHAVAFYVFLRQFGEGLGVAIGGVIFQNQLRVNLDNLDITGAEAKQYTQKATVLGPIIKQLAPGLFKSQLLTAYVGALRTLWISALAISAVGLLLTALVKSYNMDKRLETEQSFVMTPTTKHEHSSEESGVMAGNLPGFGSDHVYDNPDLTFPAAAMQRRMSEARSERARRLSLAESRRMSQTMVNSQSMHSIPETSLNNIVRRPSLAPSRGTSSTVATRMSLAERRGQSIFPSQSQGSLPTVRGHRDAIAPPLPSPKAALIRGDPSRRTSRRLSSSHSQRRTRSDSVDTQKTSQTQSFVM